MANTEQPTSDRSPGRERRFRPGESAPRASTADTLGVVTAALGARIGEPLGAVIEQMPVGVVIVEAPSGRTLTQNRRAREIWGGPIPAASQLEEYAALYPAVRPDGSAYRGDEYPIVRAIRHGEVVLDEEMEFRMPDGSSVVLLVSASPVRDSAGGIRGVVAVFAGITERQVIERRRDFLARLASAFQLRPDAAEVMRTAAIMLGEQLGVSSVAFGEPDLGDAGMLLHVEYRNGVVCLANDLSLTDLGPALAAEVAAGRTVAIEDVGADPLIDDGGVETCMARETRSLLVVPRRRNAQLQGLCLVAHVAPRRWSREDVILVQHVSERAWNAVDNARTASTLRQSEEWLRIALRAGAAVAWEWEFATDRLSWFGEHHAVLGIDPSVPVTTLSEFIALIDDQDRARAHRAVTRIAKLARMDEDREVGLEYRLSGNEARWVRVKGRVLFGMSERPERAYGVMLDITERKHAELEREALHERLRVASEAKSNFISVISHEFRTPLTSVIGYAELLSSEATGPLNERQLQQLSRIKASAWHLTQVIDEVLTFSRSEAGREEVQPRRVDTVAVARDAVTIIEPAARTHKLELDINVPETLVFTTDEAKLRQILVNLLGNAVKFTPAGTVCLRIREAGAFAVFEVEDTGIGIAPEHREKVYERFWQVDQGSTRSHGGTGLGLTVTRRLVELLGGTIELDSVVGRGSRFTVRLPIQ